MLLLCLSPSLVPLLYTPPLHSSLGNFICSSVHGSTASSSSARCGSPALIGSYWTPLSAHAGFLLLKGSQFPPSWCRSTRAAVLKQQLQKASSQVKQGLGTVQRVFISHLIWLRAVVERSRAAPARSWGLVGSSDSIGLLEKLMASSSLVWLLLPYCKAWGLPHRGWAWFSLLGLQSFPSSLSLASHTNTKTWFFDERRMQES